MTTFLRILSIASLLAAWFVLSLIFPSTIVPGPIPVFKAMAENLASGKAFFHLYKTLLRVGLGLVVTMVLGIGIGTLMGLSKKFEVFLDSWVLVGLTLPAVVNSIICLMVFGLTDRAAIVAIGSAAFPAVSISVWQGIKAMDTQLVNMGQSFYLSRGSIIRKIIFPQLLPHILASVRYALGICWKICTTVELIGMSSGVGYQLNYWFGLFSMTQVFAWTLLFLLVMFAIEYLLFKPIEKRLTRWRTGVATLQWAQ
jgi:NitT/TauT family transport system permease protein